MNKKNIATLLILLNIFILNNSYSEEKIKIGVSSALTTQAITYGNDIKNVLLFANNKLANNKYELIFEDDKCNGKEAVNVANSLINIHKVKYAIGFACSGTILSAGRIYERSKVLTMVVSASASEIKNLGNYIFRTWASDDKAAKKLFNFINKKHKNLGILSEQSDYAQGFLDSFLEANKNQL